MCPEKSTRHNGTISRLRELPSKPFLLNMAAASATMRCRVSSPFGLHAPLNPIETNWSLSHYNMKTQRTLTSGSTDMPGRSKCCGSCSWLKRILTGSLCTTLTKLPLAFSGGRRLNNVPAAPGRFSTVPL